jgi:hypothetical protein
MARQLLPLPLLVVLMASGCVGVSGTIDDQRVPAASTFFIQEDDVAEGEDDLLTIFVTSLHCGCSAVDRIGDALEDGSTPQEDAQGWASAAKRDFWELRIHLRLEDLGADLDDLEFDGLTWDQLSTAPNDSWVSFRHYKEFLDEDYWQRLEDDPDADPDPDGEYLDWWYSDGGTLSIDAHTPGSRVTGTFSTPVSDPFDGTVDGEVEISFDARRCVAAERELY